MERKYTEKEEDTANAYGAVRLPPSNEDTRNVGDYKILVSILLSLLLLCINFSATSIPMSTMTSQFLLAHPLIHTPVYFPSTVPDSTYLCM